MKIDIIDVIVFKVYHCCPFIYKSTVIISINIIRYIILVSSSVLALHCHTED